MESYAAVVVTYNRSNLLGICLDALSRQTRPLDAIVIIDNASSDDTEAVVTSFAASTILNVFYRKLESNLGGAGGFAFGTRLAHELGYSGIWLMDDDGVPADDALEQLLMIDGPAIRNSLVVDIDNPALLAFPLEHVPGAKTVADAQSLGTIANNSANPFNGTLVSSYVFDAVGFPFDGFFIWGDEVEFLNRVKAHGYAICTVTGALHRHPANRKQPYLLFDRYQVNVVDRSRLFVYMRNYSYNLFYYKGLRTWLSFMIKQLSYEVFIQRSAGRVMTAIEAATNGLFGFATKVKQGAKTDYRPAVATTIDWTDRHGAIAV